MSTPEPTPPGDTFNFHGDVHTASQTGDGYVGAMGNQAKGNVYMDTASAPDGELRELVAKLRELLEAHSGELDDPDGVADAIDELEDKVDDNAEPGRLQRALRILRRLTDPVQAFADLIAKINDIIEKMKS